MENTTVSNRLANEKSPYLLQHAKNPVNWYPWNEEAFKAAQEEEKPIFLSIGYSTCHWCHVMAQESFEDEEVAELLNRHFISIKVDREERPDIDNIYMTVCQALTGSGGWPLTVIMDADKRPFYAATYLPRNQRAGLPGLLQLLPRVAELWENERNSLLDSAKQISLSLKETDRKVKGSPLTQGVLDQAFEYYCRIFDDQWGGFGSAPKFPSPHTLLFLMRYYYFQQEDKALDMVKITLQKMYRGGIYDHIGFGFARYSTDRRWLVPHFEKMLYDNALLAMAYLEAYQLSGEEFYARVAREIFIYVLRDMTDPQGGFYSAEDADSEGEEGKFYLWTREEIEKVLGDESAQRYFKAYDISRDGNFENKNIPNLTHTTDFLNKGTEFKEARRKLFDQREKRIKPLKDDKILTGWNGLMVAALAMGARILKDDTYLSAAQNAVDFILANLRRTDGRLLASYRAGRAEYPAYAADYTYLIWGLIELYLAGFNNKNLLAALALNDELIKYFWDEQSAGLFFYGLDGEQLLSRPKEHYDGALPSDNAVAAFNFLRLARLSGNVDLEDKAQKTLDYFTGSILENPVAHSFWLVAVSYQIFPGREVVVAGNSDNADTVDILNYLNSRFDPNTLIVLKDEKINQEWGGKAQYLQPMHSVNGLTTTYICENYSCREPLVGFDKLLEYDQRSDRAERVL
ncbi:Six-hairpin glycosidase [Syntrophomonas zehnderi OL-4]|uniref:Six-hairpin glycosidase n=1 Tax=Syntrophomonas zehnderi OL-4 TaxID=690567 RepID=A0A0E3W2W5_9FIRM|nr:thioredoxin domain-containing protein [Syntrophomonas zehnderi]CFX27013.1 Six-hairpin glycosidase [Syntrophomonas zehnderi OL-4]